MRALVKASAFESGRKISVFIAKHEIMSRYQVKEKAVRSGRQTTQEKAVAFLGGCHSLTTQAAHRQRYKKTACNRIRLTLLAHDLSCNSLHSQNTFILCKCSCRDKTTCKPLTGHKITVLLRKSWLTTVRRGKASAFQITGCYFYSLTISAEYATMSVQGIPTVYRQ